MERLLKLVVEAEDQPRLDKFLAENIEGYSRGQAQALISANKVLVNDQIKTKEAFRLNPGDKVDVTVPVLEETGLLAESIPLDILYEDKDVIVVNKPAAMVVHPGAGNETGTLVNALLAYDPAIREVGEPNRPGIVHRLDKDTSGIVIVARNQTAYEFLVKQFKSRRTKKTYIALVDGTPPTPSGRIEANISRDEQYRQKMSVAYEGKGRKAVSEYKTLHNFPKHTLLEVHPITGRTHQIRVHLRYLGVPITGDRVYGHRRPSIPMDRFFLHSARLEIELPSGVSKTFEAPLTPELKKVLSALEADA